MLKTAGIILISGAISMCGAHMSFKIKQQGAVRKALCELLIHIKNGIDNGAVPLDMLYSSFKNNHLEKCGIMEMLKTAGSKNLSFETLSGKIKLPEDLCEIYSSLFSNLGKSGFKKTESELLARTILTVTEKEKIYEKQDTSGVELYTKLGILAGLFAALILI